MIEKAPITTRWGADRWEQEIGAQVRRARLLQDVTQVEVADRANVSLSSVRALEAGRGSSLRTVINVVRALGHEDWLMSLSPDPGVDPIALADAMRRSQLRQRASQRTSE